MRPLRDFAFWVCASWFSELLHLFAQLSYPLASLFSFGLFFPFRFFLGVLEECSLQTFWVVLCLPVLFSRL